VIDLVERACPPGGGDTGSRRSPTRSAGPKP
jgi:hypothetical protein